MGLSLAPAGLSLSFAITITQEKELNILTSVELHTTSVKLVANTSNWRKVVKELIGDEPVTYAERSKKDTLRRFPIVNIMSEDKEALNRVLTKAAEVE
jgi:hypothetical protein